MEAIIKEVEILEKKNKDSRGIIIPMLETLLGRIIKLAMNLDSDGCQLNKKDFGYCLKIENRAIALRSPSSPNGHLLSGSIYENGKVNISWVDLIHYNLIMDVVKEFVQMLQVRSVKVGRFSEEVKRLENEFVVIVINNDKITRYVDDGTTNNQIGL